jgi:tetratricopeptide (TPR) repeat protein/DNA-binding SARP family transcriptional activator
MPKQSKRSDSLDLRLLGMAEVFVKTRPVRLGVKALAVLAYLALEGETERRKLAWMLWPNAIDPLNSLSATRSILNGVLKNAVGGTVEHVRLETTPSLDVQLLLNANQPEAWLNAWKMYRGPFMEGFRLPEWEDGQAQDFEEWLLEQRNQFETARQNIAVQLVHHELQKDQPESALPYLQVAQGEQGNPREDMTRLAILCHGALGDTAQATTLFTQFTHHLREELGVEPMQSTRDALELVRQGNAEACRTLLQSDFAPKATRHLEPQTTDHPFVERLNELEHIHKHLMTARSHKTAVVFISGEPGSGKTRFATELMGLATDCWSFHLTAAPTGVPLEAFAGPIRQCLRSHPQLLESLGDTARMALARLIPEVMDTTNSNGAPELERAQLFNALKRILTHETHPTLLILDDLHWADQTTLDFVQHLHHDPPNNGLALVACWRNSETPIANLELLRETLSRTGPWQTIELAPLSVAAVAQLIQHAKRKDLEPEQLHLAAGGNAFYVCELLRAAPGEVPERAQEWLRARLERLPELCRQLLETATVLGQSANSNLLYRVAGRSLEETTQALEILEAARLLSIDAETYRFNHDLTREVLAQDLRGPRRSMLELRAARNRRDAPVQAAQHYQQSRDAWNEDDVEQATQTFGAAGSYLALRGDLRSGLNWYEQAIEVALTAQARLEVLIEKARALERYGRHEESLETLDVAEALLTFNDNPIISARVRIARARLMAIVYCRLEAAQDLAETALGDLIFSQGIATLRARADAFNVLGVVAFQQRLLPLATSWYQKSLTIRQALRDQANIAQSYSNLAGIHTEQREFGQAEALLRKAMSIHESLRYTGEYAENLVNLGHLQNERRNHKAARTSYETALRFYGDIQDRQNANWAIIQLGVTEFYLGNYQESKYWYEKATKAEGSQLPFLAEMIYSNLAEVSLVLEDILSAEHALESLDLYLRERQVNPIFAYDFHRFTAEIQASRLEFDAAIKSLNTSLVYAEQLSLEQQWRIRARIAEIEHQPEVLREMLKEIDGITYPGARALCLLGLAMIENDEGLAREALFHIEHPMERNRVVRFVNLKQGKILSA